jgi:hypothetical protein
MIDFVQAIGVFFVLEGGANLVWWYFHPPVDPTNATMEKIWEAGRFVRVILGIVLIALR